MLILALRYTQANQSSSIFDHFNTVAACTGLFCHDSGVHNENEHSRQEQDNYSVPHEEKQKSFFLHFGLYLRNQVSYDHVAGTIMILYPYRTPWFIWLRVT